ncbi:hypothetical protein [Mycobacterium avium]
MPDLDYDSLPMETTRADGWDRIRELGPVVLMDGWCYLSSRDDVLFALRSPEIFSSRTAFDILAARFHWSLSPSTRPEFEVEPGVTPQIDFPRRHSLLRACHCAGPRRMVTRVLSRTIGPALDHLHPDRLVLAGFLAVTHKDEKE